MDTRVNLRSSLLTNTIFFLSSLIGNSVTRNNAVATVGSQTRVVSMWIERGVDTFLDALKHLGGCPMFPLPCTSTARFHHLTVRLRLNIAPFSLSRVRLASVLPLLRSVQPLAHPPVLFVLLWSLSSSLKTLLSHSSALKFPLDSSTRVILL